MERFLRGYFFQAPQDESGDKFVRKNIPTEQTMRQFLDSIGFISESGDMATPFSQGFCMIYTDTDAINNRNNPVVQGGQQHVLKPYQAPGTGVKLVNGLYAESTPTSSSQGTPATGHGIKVTGLINDTVTGLKRIGYQVELDVSTLPDFPTQAGAAVPIKFVIWNEQAQEEQLYVLTPSTDTDLHRSFQQTTPLAVWNVQHNLGKYPAVTVTDDNKVAVVADVKYINENQVEISLNTASTGWAYFN